MAMFEASSTNRIGFRRLQLQLQIYFEQYILYWFAMQEQALCASHPRHVHELPQEHKNSDMIKMTYHFKGENSVQAATHQFQQEQETILQLSEDNIVRYRDNSITIGKTRLWNLVKQYAGNCKTILNNVDVQFLIPDYYYLKPYTTSQVLFQQTITNMTTIKRSQLKTLNRQFSAHPIIRECIQEILPSLKEWLQYQVLLCFINVVQLIDTLSGHTEFGNEKFLIKLHQISTDLYGSCEQLIFHKRSQEMLDNFTKFMRKLGEELVELELLQHRTTESNMGAVEGVDYEEYFSQFAESSVVSHKWRTILENSDTFCEI